jgi:GNAT superfamily N-acetyltransferase
VAKAGDRLPHETGATIIELPAGVSARLLLPTDSMAELTELLHRAYAPLAAAGMRFFASHQDEAWTRKRAAAGECWVGVSAGRMVATVTLADAARTSGSPWYDRPDVASFGQFAVAPELQGRGVGSALVALVERRAAAWGVAELALDTSENAVDLIRFYERRGYCFVGHVQWEVTNYRSRIFSKHLSVLQAPGGDVKRS